MIRSVKAYNRVKTYEDLEALGLGSVYCDISHRGGGLGFYRDDIAKAFKIDADLLPGKIGAGCNYAGGGLRCDIFSSTYSNEITDTKKLKLLDALIDACIRVYKSIEDEMHLNDEEYGDGEPNWEAMGTNSLRKNGTRSMY